MGVLNGWTLFGIYLQEDILEKNASRIRYYLILWKIYFYLRKKMFLGHEIIQRELLEFF